MFCGGKYAERALALKSNSKRKDYFKQGLHKSFNKRFLDHFKSSKLSLHSEDKFIETGYSYHGLKDLAKLELLNKPCVEYDNRLMFAGEACSAAFCGFLEGAIQSGVTAVQLIVNQLTPKDAEQIHLMTQAPEVKIIEQAAEIN